jgi:trehalose/maltose transport system substrate-binding protein
LRSLLNKSLLQPASLGRYQVHELLRQYATEKLEQTPPDYQAARDRHCAHYAAILNEWETDFGGPRQQLALVELEAELKNAQAAWNWAVRQDKIDDIDQALESLYHFYWLRSRFQEGQEAFRGAAQRLQALDSVPSEKVLTRLLARQGAFCYALGRYEPAKDHLQLSLTLARRFEALREIAFSLKLLGDVAREQGEYVAAKQRYQESLAITRESGDQAGMADALFALGWNSNDQSEFIEAKHYYRQSLALYRTLENQTGMARVLDKLGNHTFSVGQYIESEQFYRESLAIFKEIGDRFGVSLALGGLGRAAWVQGDARLVEAKRLFEESLTICREISHRAEVVIRLGFLGGVNISLGDYEAAQKCFREALQLAREIGYQIGLAFSLNGLGEVACKLRDFQSARQYLSEALTIAIDIQSPFDALEALMYWAILLTKDDAFPADTDSSRAARTGQALELLALAINHPASWQIFKDKVARIIADLETELSPEIVAAVQMRGKARDLWVTTEEVLAEMKARLARDESEKSRGAGKQGGGGRVSPSPPHNLLSSPTPLIGREKELTEVNDLLAEPSCRLVSIVGPGGIGKTRLSVEVARQALAQFADGVYFVSLASADSAEDIMPRIATALDPEAYPTGQTAVGFLPQLHRRDPALLVVLDNLEQLLPDGGAAIEELLSQTRRLKLIVTSRQALNIRWEWRYDLDGLAYPAGDTADALESYSAVKMFLQRVRQTRREPLAEAEVQAAARICRLVGGMPLGIELAAAQASRLPCTAIAQALERNLDALVVSLRDLPARQRSLRALFEATWANLSADEQTVFRRLSLFRSRFTMEAAQAVAEAGPLQLINLIDKSLLRQVSPERYDIHEVLRHYAQEKLTEVPDEQAQSLIRYRRYYTTFLHEKTEALQQELDLTENVAEFYTEIDNLWAGWIRVTGQDDAQEFASALVEALQAARYVQSMLVPEPSSHLEHQQQLLESRSSEADVSLIDLIWTDTLADHLLDLSEDFGDEDRTHFSAYIENNMVDGRLVAIPYSTELGLLYYRADLLAKYGFANPPVTWDELELMATEIQAGERAKGRTDFWGFIWPGISKENLTCIALEWQVSHGGGRLIESEGLITVNNPQSIAAFERAARWVGTISPMTVTEMGLDDEAARKKILAVGNVAFTREWTGFFAEQIDNPKAKDQIGVTMLPSGGAGPAATLGGEQITVSKYARHPQKAIDLVRYATNHKAQLQRLVSYPFWAPTIPDLYDQPQLVAVLPHLPKIKEMFSGNIVVRPSKVCGPLYPQVSKAYSTAVHSILTGQLDAATAVAKLETTLVEITGFTIGPPR